MILVPSEMKVYAGYVYACLLLLLLLCSCCSSESGCDAQGKDILLKIKDHFRNGRPFLTWDPHTDCCGWNGVGCGSGGRVTSLMISQPWPQEPNVIGELPSIIGELKSLELLRLEELRGLSGSIPDSITKHTKLKQLFIRATNMSGPLPDFSNMTSLFALGLLDSRFSGSIPASVSLLPNLSELNLMRNMLNGPIPESFGLFKNEMLLVLNGNKQLSGPIPKSLGNVKFRWLDLSDNKFEGDASFLMGIDKPIYELNLSQNELKFDFSNVQLPSGIKVFDISNNKIYGSLNKQLGELGQLRIFAVRDNQLCGNVPKTLFNHFGLPAFDANKCLCGAPSLPPC